MSPLKNNTSFHFLSQEHSLQLLSLVTLPSSLTRFTLNFQSNILYAVGFFFILFSWFFFHLPLTVAVPSEFFGFLSCHCKQLCPQEQDGGFSYPNLCIELRAELLPTIQAKLLGAPHIISSGAPHIISSRLNSWFFSPTCSAFRSFPSS